MQPLNVVQLDFLPASYRQQSARRRDRRWRAAIFVGGVVLLSAAWIYRALDHRAARREFEILAASHEAALLSEKACQSAQQRLTLATLEADLITYLRHPWTTSQMFAAIVGPMPDSMRLTEVKILREPLPTKDGQARPTRNPADPPDKAELLLPEAQRDLVRLREEYDNQQVVVQLSGEALDGDALHKYIDVLRSSDVFDSAELKSLERDTSTSALAGLSKFNARAVVRPGIGQPGGYEPAAAKPRLAGSRSRSTIAEPAGISAWRIAP